MVLSSVWLLPVWACVCVVHFEFTLADEKACSIARYGTLTMFNGETAEVKLPCKYRLSDFTCGDYWVKVTPGSAVDKDNSHRFSPDTVWVKVVNAKTEDYLKIRTSVRRLDKLSKGKISNPWKVKEGSVSVVDVADYDQTKAAAVLRKDGVFSVEFNSEERSVVVTCSDEEFVSQGLPEALCGDGTTTDAMNKATTTLFPGQDDVTDDVLVSYVVLNHDNVVQSPTCTDLASKFTSCQDKERAAMECVAIFGDQAECLAGSDTSLRDYYADCLTSVCDDVTSALEPMGNYIREHCGPWVERSCSDDADCPDVINVGCLKGKCVCTPGYFYSFGQDACMEGPCQADKRLYCPDGTCVNEDSFCNTLNYGCNDDSDELNCQEYTCLPGEVKCADNVTCVKRYDLCDGDNDCPDNLDEDPQFCKEHTCVPGRVKCADKVTCIIEHELCDGRKDCPDDLDEDPQMCEEHTCVPGRVKCADNATCVRVKYLCDGDDDCPDKSDEDPAMCKDHACVPGRAKKCDDGVTCIKIKYFCDGDSDCPDNSDEDPALCGQGSE